MDFKSWYEPKEFLEQALGGILAMNLQLLEGRADPERLRRAKVVSRDYKATPDLYSGLLDAEERARQEEEDRERHRLASGDRPEWKGCKITPLSAYDNEIKGLQVAARSNADTFAQILLFSPLSANVNFAKHWDNIPVVYQVLKTVFPDKIKPIDAEDEQYKNEPEKILERWLLPFSHRKYGLGATIGGWKYKTIAYVWNNRHELKERLQHIADSGGSDADLIMAMKDIPGVKPVKAGFIAQLLYGRAGCIDTHNIDIYSRAFPELKGELSDKNWQKYGGKGDIQTHKTIQAYTGTLDKLKQRGIGTKELWDVWVDFVGRMYEAILEGGLYKRSGPALNPNDPKYQELKTRVPKERILATGKKDKGNVVGIETISGTPAGGGASLTHDLPRHDPHHMIQQLYKQHLGDPSAEPFTHAIVRQKKMMGPKPAAVHYFEPALDKDTGEVDPDRMKDLLHGFGQVGADKMRRKMAKAARKKLEKDRTLYSPRPETPPPDAAA